MNKQPEKWSSREHLDPLSDREKQAYRHMQAVVFNPAGKSTDLPRKIIEQEAMDTDFTTPRGRKERSERNLEFIRGQNADCPFTLIQELSEKIRKMPITLYHQTSIHPTADYHSPILEAGEILSNMALKEKGVVFESRTDVNGPHDSQNFGNTDFVFTRPIFGAPSHRIGGTYFPASDTILNDYAWLSFDDWLNTDIQQYNDSRYTGNKVTHEKELCFLYDFFQGKNDIAQAVAYKTYETIKTAMLIYKDENARYGFDEEKVGQYIDDFASHFRGHIVHASNRLTKPLSEYTISDKQRAFLEDADNAERNTLIQAALNSTLEAVSQLAEVKVPHSIPLDGGACLYKETFHGGWELARFTSDPSKPHPLEFKDAYPEHNIIVRPSHYPIAQQAHVFLGA
ncbi:MAG: hypothetical protein LW823_03475 [Rickettsiales bacterium]|jgi:hypothetical protein|nr:hypothetical protein [Rickettsiales bacterium]